VTTGNMDMVASSLYLCEETINNMKLEIFGLSAVNQSMIIIPGNY